MMVRPGTVARSPRRQPCPWLTICNSTTAVCACCTAGVTSQVQPSQRAGGATRAGAWTCTLCAGPQAAAWRRGASLAAAPGQDRAGQDGLVAPAALRDRSGTHRRGRFALTMIDLAGGRVAARYDNLVYVLGAGRGPHAAGGREMEDQAVAGRLAAHFGSRHQCHGPVGAHAALDFQAAGTSRRLTPGKQLGPPRPGRQAKDQRPARRRRDWRERQRPVSASPPGRLAGSSVGVWRPASALPPAEHLAPLERASGAAAARRMPRRYPRSAAAPRSRRRRGRRSQRLPG
jgi:hypothetical protein